MPASAATSSTESSWIGRSTSLASPMPTSWRRRSSRDSRVLRGVTVTLLSIAQQGSRVKDMDFSPSPRAADLTERVRTFLQTEIEPVEADYHHELAALRAQGGDAVWQPLPLIAELQAKARSQGLWNLFLPFEHAGEYAARYGTAGGAGLSNVDYAPIAELTGRSA